MKKILRVLLFLFIALFFSNNQTYAELQSINKNLSPDEKEWLKIYYKESMEQYKYIFDGKNRSSLKKYVYNYFLDSSLKLWINTSKIKMNNFVLLTDSSIELRPASNILFRVIIEPETKVVSEIMLSEDKSDHIENSILFYNLSRIAIDIINTDLTKDDVDSIYNKLSVEQIAIDKNYTAGLLQDGIDYSIFYVQDSVFFVLKKTRLEVSSFFKETGKEKEAVLNKNKFANEDEFYDVDNPDASN